ncbi:MAG: hypothetical protein IPJ81_04585 [Chitinophagaceae bacterium]|nr:hypothetical protein [Chitinophagaceae bacterium]
MNDGQLLNLTHTYDEPRRMMIFSTLFLYHNGAKNNYIDPIKIASEKIALKHPYLSFLQKFAYCEKERYLAYLPWLKKYMHHAVDKEIKTIKIYQNYIHYTDQNLPFIDSTVLKYSIE